MKEKTLLKIALTISVLGIFLLYLVSGNIDIETSRIGQVSSSDEGKDIKVKGIVSDVFETEKVMIVDIYERNPKKMSVVVFKDGKTSIYPGMELEIIGEAKEYEGKMELIATEVKQTYP